MKKILIALAAASAMTVVASPTMAQSNNKSSGRKAQERASAEIPVCTRKLGSLAIVEPEVRWWSEYGLSSPEALIKVMVQKSGCFTLVDRGRGLQNRNIERALADSGELQRGSNIGRGQIRAADYFLVPDLVTRNRNSGGGGIGGALGGLIGNRTLGAIAGGLNVKKKEANVTLTLVNSRTTEQERLTEGYARKTDIGFGGSGLGWGSALGALGGSSYENTEIGQVIVLAYLDAYRDLVTQLGGLPYNPSAAAPRAR